jgi:hypothetical protein
MGNLTTSLLLVKMVTKQYPRDQERTLFLHKSKLYATLILYL